LSDDERLEIRRARTGSWLVFAFSSAAAIALLCRAPNWITALLMLLATIVSVVLLVPPGAARSQESDEDLDLDCPPRPPASHDPGRS
jgi:hypothetical protein